MTTFLFPPLVAGIVTLIVWVVLTGGLHLDGLADCCDGLFASVSPERRLEIMKDPHVGAFGVIGLILILFLKAAALASLTPVSSFGILLAASLARWCILPAGLLPLARSFRHGLRFCSRLSTFIYCLECDHSISSCNPAWFARILSSVAGLGAAVLVLWLAKSRIGGVTGDVFGMIVEIVEAVSVA